MIRVAALVFVCAMPAGADCLAERDFVVSAMGVNGMTIRDPGTLVGSAPCRVEGLAFDQGSTLTITVEAIEWSLEGVEENGFSDTVALEISARNARILPTTQDRWVAYLLAEQARRNTIDADLRLSWQPKSGVLDIERFTVDLPGQNAFSMTSRTRGIAQTIFFGQPPADLTIEAMTLSVENTGFLDGLLVSFMVDQVRTVPGEPRRVMDATLAEVADLIGTWPLSVFPDDSLAELQAMVLEGPAPWGKLDIALEAPEGLGLQRFMVAGAQPLGAAETLSTLFDGATVDVTYVSLEPE